MKGKQLTHEEVLARLPKGFKLLEPYKTGGENHRFLCPLCEKEFLCTPYRICRKLTRSCGCFIKTKRIGTEFVSGLYYGKIKYSAKERNIQFDVSLEYLSNLLVQQNFKCALSGIELTYGYTGRKNKHRLTLSLDRIDSTKGYIEGNVQWVHKNINFMKSNLNQDKFFEYCKKIVEFNNL